VILSRSAVKKTCNAGPLVFEKRDTPGAWRKVIDTERSIGMKCWGFPLKTAYIVKGASGSQRVCWTDISPRLECMKR